LLLAQVAQAAQLPLPDDDDDDEEEPTTTPCHDGASGATGEL